MAIRSSSLSPLDRLQQWISHTRLRAADPDCFDQNAADLMRWVTTEATGWARPLHEGLDWLEQHRAAQVSADWWTDAPRFLLAYVRGYTGGTVSWPRDIREDF